MRAYKTVNDAYVEPISFTVPRRAETFQSDIYEPCVGIKPAVSAQEWVAGKSGIPPKIDFESIYEGNEPVEIPADYKPPVSAPALAPAPAPASKPAPKQEPEPTPAPAFIRPPPSVKEQQGSMAAMVSKYEDNEDDQKDEASSFDETSKPPQRSTIPARSEPKAPSPTKTTFAPLPRASSPIKSPTFASTPTTSVPAPAVSRSVSAGSGVESTLDQIKLLLETQTKMLSAQVQQIERLTADLDSLKKRVGPGSQDQSERIRQLELELEELRS
jgi:coronin-1B/1C/6